MILTPFDLLESWQREKLLLLHKDWSYRGGYLTCEYRKDEDAMGLADFVLDKATILGWYIAGINPFA